MSLFRRILSAAELKRLGLGQGEDTQITVSIWLWFLAVALSSELVDLIRNWVRGSRTPGP